MKTADLLPIIAAHGTQQAAAGNHHLDARMALVWDILKMADMAEPARVDDFIIALHDRLERVEDEHRKNAIRACERALAKLA